MSGRPRWMLNEALAAKPLLLTAAIDSAVPAFVEIAGDVGYDIAWLDLEHHRRSPAEIEAFCLACNSSGVASLLRIADASRESILPALEMGARLVVIPMVESVATAQQIVAHGKFAPTGNRGFNGGTRGMWYGLTPSVEAMKAADRDTWLFPQIETMEGARNCEGIVDVEGIAGALVGPADLSISAGMPLDFENPEFLKIYTAAITTIRKQGKIAATATVHPVLIRAAIEAGVQILVCITDTAAVREQLKESYRKYSRTTEK